jgi:glutathione synthase/RimK-type ligase-like ATP-grasp enzyme
LSDVLLATAANLPKPDPESHLLRAALSDIGVSSAMAGWDDPSIDWASAKLVLIRSPWNYDAKADEFLAWAKHVASVTTLQNAIGIVEWNIHKSYLIELARKGVPVMPTTLIAKDSSEFELPDGLCVVKPAIDGGARGAKRGLKTDAHLVAHVAAIAKKRDVLVQPYAQSIEQGEVSLIYFGHVYSHAVRKVPKSGDYRVQSQYGGAVIDHTPTKAEFETAEKALAAAPGRTTYARVDMVDYNGVPTLMELEVIEPELFLGRRAVSAAILADILKKQL